MDTRIPHPQGYLICVLESIAMGASPHAATAYLFTHNPELSPVERLVS